MPTCSPFKITLTASEKTLLKSRANKYTSPYRDVVRAKIVLYAAQGLQNKEIAARLDTSPQIVCKWRKRYFKFRIRGLNEQPRGERKPYRVAGTAR
jgi:transposase